MRSALRIWWNIPPSPDNPGNVWWDRWLVAAAIFAIIIEAVFRPDMPWRPVGVLVSMVFATALYWRRTRPMRTTLLVFGLAAMFNVLALLDADWRWEVFSAIFVLVFPYALMRWGSGRQQIAGLIVIGLTYLLTLPTSEGLEEIIGGGVVLALPAVIGAEVRSMSTRRRQRIDEVRLRERSQLARELHDTVAHHVSAIAIQAQAGKEIAKTDVQSALDRLAVIESEASKTLQEMRSMVGALREDDEPELAPAPGVAQLTQFSTRSADSPQIHVDLVGELSDLSPAVDSAVYRMVQESITNAGRHGRGVSEINIRISRVGSDIELLIENNGESTLGVSDGGYGLIGMEERAKLLGGSFAAGPIREGGWRVSATLPHQGHAE